MLSAHAPQDTARDILIDHCAASGRGEGKRGESGDAWDGAASPGEATCVGGVAEMYLLTANARLTARCPPRHAPLAHLGRLNSPLVSETLYLQVLVWCGSVLPAFQNNNNKKRN